MNKNREIIQDFIAQPEPVEEENSSIIGDTVEKVVDAIGDVEVGNIELGNVDEVIEELDDKIDSSTPKIKDFSLVPESGMKVAKGFGNFFTGLKSPSGGIAILLGLILFILFAIKKVDGKDTTRLGLLFQSFLTNTEMEGFETKNKSTGETVADAVGDKVVENAESGTVPIWGSIMAPVLNNMLSGAVE